MSSPKKWLPKWLVKGDQVSTAHDAHQRLCTNILQFKFRILMFHASFFQGVFLVPFLYLCRQYMVCFRLYVCMCVCDAMPCIYHLPFAASPLYYSQQFKQYICVDTIYHFVAFYFFYHGYSLVLVETFQSRSLDEFTFICEHRPFLFLFVGE